MQIIIGLGNPDKKYELTRHNAGFMAVDAMAEKHDSTWKFNKKFNAEIAELKETEFPAGNSVSDKIILAKPQTFMNNSGQAVQAIMSYYKLLPKLSLSLPSLLRRGLEGGRNSDLSNILIIIHDDIDIELGKYKISTDSRSAGHNGVQSIINHLKTKNFKRIRIGIKTEMATKMPAEKFVLQRFNEEEMKVINNLIPEIIAELKNSII